MIERQCKWCGRSFQRYGLRIAVFCSIACRNKGRAKHRPIETITTEAGCIVCTSHTGRSGYPKIVIRQKNVVLHRRVYEQTHGPIPVGMVIRHKCDNPGCINPDHLLLGTHADNVADRVARNRSALGERNGRSKLTVEQVREIRASSESLSVLSKRYGVCGKVISQIKRRLKWASVA